MKTRLIACLAAGLIASPVFAKLPPPPPMSDAEKAAKAEKDAAGKAKAAADLAKRQDMAVANYKKGHGVAEPRAAMPVKAMAPMKK